LRVAGRKTVAGVRLDFAVDSSGTNQGIDISKSQRLVAGTPVLKSTNTNPKIEVTLLTGGGDRPYAYGLGTELISKGVFLDVIGSDDLDCPEFHGSPRVNFLNLRGDQRTNVSVLRKVVRVTKYYARLIGYAATSKPRIFHILWNNKLELFDRTLLMLYYKSLGKKIVLTIHNVNKAKRDSRDTSLNRLTLRIQYRFADHIFVHTEQMKQEIISEFGVKAACVSVIPFGINNSVPDTSLTSIQARQKLGITDREKTILFFGNITPYKGLDLLIAAFQQIRARHDEFRLIIAGWPKNCEKYWSEIQELIREDVLNGRILLRAEYIADSDTELYFKAADVFVLPYRYIYQSGVLFLGYSFGLPVLAADVGTLKDEIAEGKTGFVFKSEDPTDLAKAIERYFASDLFMDLSGQRTVIREFARERHSWDVVGQLTIDVYASTLRLRSSTILSNPDASRRASLGGRQSF
jgi:D-inositol-3-phosphate glycosyltransferase